MEELLEGSGDLIESDDPVAENPEDSVFITHSRKRHLHKPQEDPSSLLSLLSSLAAALFQPQFPYFTPGNGTRTGFENAG